MKSAKLTKRIFAYILLIFLAYIMLYPLLFMITASFKPNEEIFGNMRLLPVNPVFDAYLKGWRGSGQYSFAVFFANSFLLVIPTVIFTMISAVLVGYGFARFHFPFKRPLFILMLSTLMLPATVVVIPRYIYFNYLGWLNSYLPFIIPAALGSFPFFNFMMVQFFRGLPMELDESARMDGCSSFRTLLQILAPLCKPAIFSVVVFQFVWTWNDFFNSLIYINSVRKYPIALGLRMTIDVAAEIHWNQILAMSCLALLPPSLLFFLAQNYFVEGIAASGIKE